MVKAWLAGTESRRANTSIHAGRSRVDVLFVRTTGVQLSPAKPMSDSCHGFRGQNPVP